MSIKYTLVETPLGLVVMAATEQGIAVVHFGPSESALKGEQFFHDLWDDNTLADDHQSEGGKI